MTIPGWFLPTTLLAVALAMDAVAVAAAQAAAFRPAGRHVLLMALCFGAAQGVMPLFGWFLGTIAANLLASIDHWIVLAILGLLGIAMIRAGMEADKPPQQLSGNTLFLASIATSIDAFAAGISLPLIGAPAVAACALIAGITASLCLIAARVGAIAGARFGRWAEIGGGLLLIAIGVRTFISHQFGMG